MFRREIDGVSHYFETAGLWGSGNTVTERALIETGENTVYTSWTGEGLVGPRTGEFLDKYPALWGTLTLGEFIDRYGWLGTECKVWLGAEDKTEACEAVCGHLGDGDHDVIVLAVPDTDGTRGRRLPRAVLSG